MISPEATTRSQGVQTPKTCPKPAPRELLSKLPSSTTGCIVAASCQAGRELFPAHPCLSGLTCPGAFFSKHCAEGIPMLPDETLNLLQCLTTTTVKMFLFVLCLSGFSGISFCARCVFSTHGIPLRRVQLHFLFPSPSGIYTH